MRTVREFAELGRCGRLNSRHLGSPRHQRTRRQRKHPSRRTSAWSLTTQWSCTTKPNRWRRRSLRLLGETDVDHVRVGHNTEPKTVSYVACRDFHRTSSDRPISWTPMTRLPSPLQRSQSRHSPCEALEPLTLHSRLRALRGRAFQHQRMSPRCPVGSKCGMVPLSSFLSVQNVKTPFHAQRSQGRRCTILIDREDAEAEVVRIRHRVLQWR